MKKGVLYSVLAYLAWGFLPLYWRLFTQLSAWEILTHRIVWSFVFVALLVTVGRHWRRFKPILKSAKSTAAVILCSVLISTNWFVFIWAVNHNHVIETSLGYYINPLISVLFAVVFLGERLAKGQWIALLIAGVGVGIMTVQYGQFPWIALTLAVSFALYGLAKKVAKLDVLLGLSGETFIALPVALGYLVYLQGSGTGGMGLLSPLSLALLLLSGVATAMPLFWFAKSMQLLPLSIAGFLQYIAPTTTLLLAVFQFHEPFTTWQLVSFSLIWIAILVYSLSAFRKPKPVVMPAQLAESA